MEGWDWQGVPQAWVIEIQKVLDFYGLDILTFSMINLSFIYQTNKQTKPPRNLNLCSWDVITHILFKINVFISVKKKGKTLSHTSRYSVASKNRLENESSKLFNPKVCISEWPLGRWWEGKR